MAALYSFTRSGHTLTVERFRDRIVYNVGNASEPTLIFGELHVPPGESDKLVARRVVAALGGVAAIRDALELATR